MIEKDGKYDSVAIGALEFTKADGVIVLIIGGDKGHGMSVAVMKPDVIDKLPVMLRELADGIEASYEQKVHSKH